jgi:hypothetical protein
VPDDDSWVVVSVAALSTLQGRLDIVECTWPAAAGLANTPIFYVGGSQSGCSYCSTEMSRMREIISVAPESSMNHDNQGNCSVADWKSKVDELVLFCAVRDSKVGRWWRKG